MKVFEVLRKGGDPRKPFQKYGVAVAELVSRIPQGTAYEYMRRGTGKWIRVPSKPKLKEILSGKRLAVGEAFYARRVGGRAIFVLRAVELAKPTDPCPDPNATEGVKRCWDAVQGATRAAEVRFGRQLEVVFMGIYNCRRIDGSSTWSQHAWRNGLDFRIRRASADAGSIDVEATTFVVYRTREVAEESLWQVAGHTYHAHLTGAPKRFGTPPCA